METITYSLLGDHPTSDQYYTQINAFTSEVVEKNNIQNSVYINQYIRYLADKNVEKLMPKEIISFEFLMIGVLWNTYIDRSIELNQLSGHVLKKMVSLREKKEI